MKINTIIFEFEQRESELRKMYDKSCIFKGQKKIILYTTSLTYKSSFGERMGKRVLGQLFLSSVLSQFLNIITFKIKERGKKKE